MANSLLENDMHYFEALISSICGQTNEALFSMIEVPYPLGRPSRGKTK